MHGISKLTLYDHISGNVTNGDKPRPYQLLSPAEEEELSNLLVEVAHAGYGKKRRKILDVSHEWFGRFMLKHPDLSYWKYKLTID